MNARVISFGAGVQSSAMLLMSDRREIPRADFAVFADTQAEPMEVYTWLEKMQKAVSIPIVVTTKGNIAHDVIDHWKGRKPRVGQPPLFTLRHLRYARADRGMLRRHCTKEYKIQPVDSAIRTELGYRPRQKVRHKVEVMIGISFDEMERMRISQVPWKSNVYPLVDLRMNRDQCIAYVESAGLGRPPRSACYFCPYKTNAEWRHLRDTSPADWQRAVEFDREIRTSVSPKLASKFFVHRSRLPLELADITPVENPSEAQISFLDECEGMCGL